LSYDRQMWTRYYVFRLINRNFSSTIFFSFGFLYLVFTVFGDSSVN
jgi:hypothetical protein